LIKKVGYEDITIEKKIRGRVFFTLFVPSKERIEVEMEIASPEIVVQDAISVFAEASLQQRFSDNKDQEFSSQSNTLVAARGVRAGRLINPYRPIIVDTIKDFTIQEVDQPYVTSLLSQALAHTANIHQASDIFDAAKSWINATSTDEALFFLKKQTDRIDIFYNFYKTLPLSTRQDASEDFEKNLIFEVKQYLAQKDAVVSLTSQVVKIAGHNFSKISTKAGMLASLKDNADKAVNDSKIIEFAPEIAESSTFYILNSEVSCAMFDTFLEANPQWKRENLLEKSPELADNLYLDAMYYRGGYFPATNISWHAAKAYCQWMTSQLPSQFSGWIADLPTTQEHQIAASVANLNNSNIVKLNKGTTDMRVSNFSMLNDLYGNVWEWNSDWYSKNAQVTGLENGFFKAVAGGAWFNNDSEITQFTVGGLPPEACSPYTGFRVVLRKK
ncbi:MAG: SUMF1/EgtB/PvdO family nonheme iron enzyme, partial [Spirochaetales bacterium]|nr:SUMF1/EgtB/PvdO family nonheme iron enzyme [Spirochaetales bacterium]